MSSARRVPETWSLGEGELSADHAWRAAPLRGVAAAAGCVGTVPLWRRVQPRPGPGLQLCLAAVPLLIALNGLASKLGDPHQGGRVVAETVLALTPGASESLVNQLLTDQGRTGDLSQVALAIAC
jgi:hypothetical protein